MADETTPVEEPQQDPEEQKTAEEEAEFQRRSEAAKKAAETRRANQRQATLVEDVYKHIRHTIGTEISIGQAQQLVELIQERSAAE